MAEYAANTQVVITVPHTYNGQTLILTGLDFQLLDSAGAVIVARSAAPAFNASNESTPITLSVANNTTAAKRDARQLNCWLITSGGEYIVSQVYTLKGNLLSLTVMTDSFMTFPESVLTRAKMADEQYYYDPLTDELKAIALEEAFKRLCKVKYKDGATTDIDLSTYTKTQFDALSAGFREAIKKAQIAEANAIVEDSPIKDKIRSGIISETIGESSMFFRQSYPSTGKYQGLSEDAYNHLLNYIYRDVKSSQIWTLNRA